MLGCVTPGSSHLEIIPDCEIRGWVQQWPHPCSSELWCLQQGWVVLTSCSVAPDVTVCAFLSDFYWYTDHSCEEYKTPSVPAPHLPGIPCSGTVQPEHRWQCYYAGNPVGRGRQVTLWGGGGLQGCASPRQVTQPLRGAQAVLTCCCISTPPEHLPPPVYHESTVVQGLQWLCLIIPECGELQQDRQQPGCFFYFSALEHVKKPTNQSPTTQPSPKNKTNL